MATKQLIKISLKIFFFFQEIVYFYIFFHESRSEAVKDDTKTTNENQTKNSLFFIFFHESWVEAVKDDTKTNGPTQIFPQCFGNMYGGPHW
jgi:hypothetical protein